MTINQQGEHRRMRMLPKRTHLWRTSRQEQTSRESIIMIRKYARECFVSVVYRYSLVRFKKRSAAGFSLPWKLLSGIFTCSVPSSSEHFANCCCLRRRALELMTRMRPRRDTFEIESRSITRQRRIIHRWVRRKPIEPHPIIRYRERNALVIGYRQVTLITHGRKQSVDVLPLLTWPF